MRLELSCRQAAMDDVPKTVMPARNSKAKAWALSADGGNKLVPSRRRLPNIEQGVCPSTGERVTEPADGNQGHGSRRQLLPAKRKENLHMIELK